MGTAASINKLNFEAVQIIAQTKNVDFIIVNTLDSTSQDCLIKGTIQADKEVGLINSLLSSSHKNSKILIYGENCSDAKVIAKYNQLHKLGFTNLYVYAGGLFEWLLLQDVYGDDEFPTTTKIIDILRFKGINSLSLKNF